MLARLWNSPTATTWGSIAVRLSSAIVVLPLVLVRFAPAEVTVWQLFATLFAINLLLDFGLSPTFARLIAFARGGASLRDMVDMRRPTPTSTSQADSAAISMIFGTMRWLFPRLALVIIVVLGMMCTLALLRPIAQTSSVGASWIAWALVLMGSAIGLIGNSYGATLQGLNRIAVLRRWEVITGLAQVLSCFVVVALGAELLLLVATYQLWVLVGVWRTRWLLKRLHPEVYESKPCKHSLVLEIVWPATWRSGIGTLMSQGIIQGSGVIYSQFVPPTQAAAYLLALRVIMMISQFSQASFYSKLPRLAELHAQGANEEKILLAQRGMRFSHWIYVSGVLFVALAADRALMAINSQTPFVTQEIWALIALAFFLERFGAMHLQLYTLTNHVVWHIANGVTGIVMVCLAFWAYPQWGERALPLAMLAAYGSFYCVYSARLSSKALGLRLAAFELRTALPAGAVLCSALLVIHLNVV